MNEVLIRKDGSQSVAFKAGPGLEVRPGVDPLIIDYLVGEHVKLREYGFHTGQVSSGAVLDGTANALSLGLDPAQFSDKILAMNGLPSHFGKWTVSALKSGLLTASSLSTAIELKDSDEGRQIKGGMGEALAHPKVLLVANYHDEADLREMNLREQKQVQQGTLFRTESEENDFHAANIGLAVGATTLMLCTMADGFIYKGKKLASINIEDVPKYIQYIRETSTHDKNVISKGGMITKLEAAKEFIVGSAALNRPARVVIGHSAEDSRRLLEDNAGTWVVQ